MFQRGQIAIGAAAAIMMLLALAVVLVPMRCGRSGASRGKVGPWLTSTFDAAFDAASPRFELPLCRRRGSPSMPFSGLFALIYLMPLFVIVANSFRELPEIAHNGLIAHAAQSSRSRRGPKAWAHFCVAGTCEGIQRNFYNSLHHDDPRDDHLDPDRRDQRLRPVEMAVSGLGDAVRLHDARRLHARPDRALPWAYHPGLDRVIQLNLRPHPRPLSSRAYRSRRCSAATTTSTSPTT